MEIERLQRQIEKVENDIEKVANDIEKAENALQAADLTEEDKKYWRNKEQALRLEKQALRDKEQALRLEKQALPRRNGTSGSLALQQCNMLKEFWKRAKAFKLEQLKDFLELPELKKLSCLSINVPNRKGLYVRKCFSDFYRKIMDAFQNHRFVHVNGTPGVGKSAFLWYVVHRAAIACEFDVIVELGHAESRTSAGIIFYRNGSVNYSPTFTSLEICGDGPFLHLVDQVFLGHHFGQNIIIFASPDEDNTKGVLKCGGGALCRKVMPSWRKELEGFLLLCKMELPKPNLDYIQAQTRLWGIIPRVVFDMENEPAYLDEVIAKCNLELGAWWVGRKVQLMEKSVPCKLFELEPIDEEYKISSVRFASKYLGERYWQYYWEKQRGKLISFLKSSAGMVDLSALRGFIYENCLIGSWTETCDVVLHARSLRVGPSLRLNIGQRTLRRFRSPKDIRIAHAANEDLEKFLWVPMKNSPLFDALAFPNFIIQATVADGETSGHDVLQMALINIATLMWDLNSGQQVLFLVVVPTDGVTKWQSSSLHWKNSSGEDLQRFNNLLNEIGLYVAGYDPPGLDSEDVPADDGTVWKELDAKEHAELAKHVNAKEHAEQLISLSRVKEQAFERVLQKRKASSLDDLSAMGSKSTAELIPELEKMRAKWPDGCDEDDDMDEFAVDEAHLDTIVQMVCQSAEQSQA